MTAYRNDFWRGRRVFLSGHTGFKGSWLKLWLRELGASVAGASLAPADGPNLHALVFGDAERHELVDIRDREAILAAVRAAEPEIVLHLAAQPLVRLSYREPQDTFVTNVIGTVNVMEAIRQTPSVKAAVMVTTDKVYANDGAGRAFEEGDRLGGHDPYSNSKACAELAVQCYRDSFFSSADAPAVATARAGNVIGGGDWSEDRLVPDIVRAMLAGAPVELRYPDSVRPWQHVLDPLHGYLMLAQALLTAPSDCPRALNFGPDPTGFVTVSDLADRLSAALAGGGWRAAPGSHPPEAHLLTLATGLAQDRLGWKPVLNVEETVDWTAQWYRDWRGGADMRALTLRQIRDFCARVH